MLKSEKGNSYSKEQFYTLSVNLSSDCEYKVPCLYCLKRIQINFNILVIYYFGFKWTILSEIIEILNTAVDCILISGVNANINKSDFWFKIVILTLCIKNLKLIKTSHHWLIISQKWKEKKSLMKLYLSQKNKILSIKNLIDLLNVNFKILILL